MEGRSPSTFNPQGWLRHPEDAIFAKQSLPCESKNRFRSVFAPGNFRRSFSKNCKPLAQPSLVFRFDQTAYQGNINQPLKMNLRFILSDLFYILVPVIVMLSTKVRWAKM